MGSDRKSEEHSKRKSKKKRAYSSDSADDRKARRQRTDRDEETRSSRGERKDRSKKGKHHTDKEKKSKEKRKSKHDKHVAEKLKVPELSSDDYFSKNNEFATWLKEERDMFFSDLSSESARKLFSEFVEDWNCKKLKSRYYEGIEIGPRSAHKWKIRQ